MLQGFWARILVGSARVLSRGARGKALGGRAVVAPKGAGEVSRGTSIALGPCELYLGHALEALAAVQGLCRPLGHTEWLLRQQYHRVI